MQALRGMRGMRYAAAMAVTLTQPAVPAVRVPAPRPQAHNGAAPPRTAGYIDCDAHNYPQSIAVLLPFMAQRWRSFVEQIGYPGPLANLYPKVYADAARRDAYPPGGGKPGSDPQFAARQLLDTWGLTYAVLNPLYAHSQVRNLHLGSELARAVNRWTAAHWLDADPRWRGSIVVNIEDPEAAAAEIGRVARDGRFVQVLLLVRSPEPYGRQRYRPIFRAAVEAGLPVGIHFGGGGGPITGVGWPSYYIEDHTGMAQAFQSQVISLVCEGVLEELPECRIALVEGGFAWLPPLMWRLDKNYKGLRAEVPWLTRLPSEYIRERFRATTQPMEEPDDPEHLRQIVAMLGRDDFLMFATDYPHWDFDAPDRALQALGDTPLRRAVTAANARAFYDFERGAACRPAST